MNIFPLIVNIEATNGRGEDNHLIAPERVDVAQTVVIAVFDGLGGRSAGYDELTGGRIASAIASERTRKFLGKHGGKLNEELVIQLQEDICKTLKEDADAKIKPSRIRGSLAGKRLCTTVAIASIHKQEEGCEVNLAWMGDSRIYFLSTEKGLQQLTSDDLETKKDAFEMIHEDPPMSKYLTADIPSEWRMNFNSDKFESSGCILACTDGCFQYMPSPWDFEKLLLSSLNSSNTIEEWESLLHQEYEEIKQDDVSLILYSVGFLDFETLKQSYQERLTYLRDNFDSRSSSYDDLKKFWEKYRCNYEEKIKLSKITATAKEGAEEPTQINQVDNKEAELNKSVEGEDDSSLSQNPATTELNDDEKSQKISELLGQAFNASNPQKSIQVYEEVIKLEPEHVKANFNIGICYAELGLFAKAVDCFKDVINKKDEKFTLLALLELCTVYRKMGNNEKAELAQREYNKIWQKINNKSNY